MLGISNLNQRNFVYFRGGNCQNLQNNVIHSLDAFENKMLDEERALKGYILPEVRTAIENKIQALKLKAQNVMPHKEAELIKPLSDAIAGRYDITATYMALGEFEKKLSEI